jgi:solute carrier family 25 iron transporter 28/37
MSLEVPVVEIEPDWEEWDGSSPFWIHCIAGSVAGVTEHAATYPLDTVRTHIQVCASCMHNNNHNNTATTGPFSNNTLAVRTGTKTKVLSANALLRSSTATASTTANLPLGMWQTIRYLVSEPVLPHAAATNTNAVVAAGWIRLWRGVQTILIGCVPAHALYFSSYEIVKTTFTTNDPKTGQDQLSTLGSSLAGAAATFTHDLIMTPLDTVKQRMQLGHYNGVMQAFQDIFKHESFHAFYRSFPITLVSNIPYGMIMVTTHETCKEAWKKHPDRPADMATVLVFSSVAGFTASAFMIPLD